MAAHNTRVSRLFGSILFAATLLRADDPSRLEIRIVEGEGAIYSTGSRATRGITVLVTDETGKPVDGATVTFRMPEEGPSGAFANGTTTEILTTRADGQAAVWGMPWNRKAGAVAIRITAVKGATRAGTVCTIELRDAAASREPASGARVSSGSSHKWVWLTLGIAAAAGGGVAAAGIAGKSTATAAPQQGLRIGSPGGVNLGRP